MAAEAGPPAAPDTTPARFEEFAHLHRDAVRALTAYEPLGDTQRALRADFLDLLDDDPGTVARSGPPVHLTVGVLVLADTLDAVLLTLHRKARRWFQFGGHLEASDSSLYAAAAREAREESGIPDLRVDERIVHLDRHALPGGFGSCHAHCDVRHVALVSRETRPRVSEESIDVRWWPVAELPTGTADLVPLVHAAVGLVRER